MLRAMLLLSIVLSWPPSIDEARAADIANGERLFRACSGCHSMEPGRHLTGPSLAGVIGHRAGTAEGFRRYSDALKSADLIWTEDTLDAWLTDPKGLIPGNLMTFPGIDDPEARRDLIAFIQAAQSGAPQGSGQGEGGMMGGPALDDLEYLPPENQVDAITYCGDTYRVTTRAGQTIPFWEFNLRFKTDSSDRGPAKGSPALLRASMMGDRAFVIFADPAEISSFIQPQC